MFTDISVSVDLNNKFNTHLKDSNVDLGETENVYSLKIVYFYVCVFLCRHQPCH